MISLPQKYINQSPREEESSLQDSLWSLVQVQVLPPPSSLTTTSGCSSAIWPSSYVCDITHSLLRRDVSLCLVSLFFSYWECFHILLTILSFTVWGLSLFLYLLVGSFSMLPGMSSFSVFADPLLHTKIGTSLLSFTLLAIPKHNPQMCHSFIFN